MLPSTKITPNAKLLDWDLVEVKPLGPPVGHIFYMDFKYKDLLEERNKKIKKIKGVIENEIKISKR